MAPPPPPALALLLLPLVLAAEQMPVTPTLMPQLELDPGVPVAERFALRYFNLYAKFDNYFRASLLSFQTMMLSSQITEIKAYNLKMEMVKTQCRKERGKELDWANLQKCQFAPLAEMKKIICDFEIWNSTSPFGKILTKMMEKRCRRYRRS